MFKNALFFHQFMTIELYTLGGFQEIGRNMTLIKYKNESIVLDLGLHLDNYIPLINETQESKFISIDELLNSGSVPDIRRVQNLLDTVKAIIPSHAHLDHVGAIPFLGKLFKNATIIATPYTIAVLKELKRDISPDTKFRIKVSKPNSKIIVSKNFKVHFIASSHSVPHTVFIVVETPEGNIVYANDYKIDFSPIVGDKPNLKRLAKFRNPELLIIDSLYANRLGKTPSESVARAMLKDVLTESNALSSAIFVTTFSSHIARLKSLVELSKKIRRQPIFIGRSLFKYIKAAESINLVKFSSKYKLIRFNRQLVRILKRVEKNKKHYLIICTGHQGEPNSILSRIVFNDMFNFTRKDTVIFSSNIIPNEENMRNRERLRVSLENKNVNIYEDVHVSGHASRQDHRELLELLLPKRVIPAHSTPENSIVFKDFVEKNFKKIKVITASEGDAYQI
ncbi:MAG: ribonuclease [Candidatus Woesearchaeota archaeon]|nr:ribonuclease [Candidatus Woesearchaeota archaeon]MDN5328032.1 ribonuclease [Candidatus Woesearchaeota archaeon]